MWDLVGNPEDRFSHNQANMVPILLLGAMFSVSSIVLRFKIRTESSSCISFISRIIL